MICFHKWKDVPLEGKTGFLRKCSKCNRKEGKGWVIIVIPKFKFWNTQPIIGWPWKHKILAIEFVTYRLFMTWKLYEI